MKHVEKGLSASKKISQRVLWGTLPQSTDVQNVLGDSVGRLVPWLYFRVVCSLAAFKNQIDNVIHSLYFIE
jgi:hypothetical protein